LTFPERDRAVLTLLRPHLHRAYLDVERMNAVIRTQCGSHPCERLPTPGGLVRTGAWRLAVKVR